jgi:hypothetical protein
MAENFKIELLAPAGNPEKLEIAIHYGADAIYLAGKEFSLRNFSGNFTYDELQSAVKYAHKKGVKVYVACNIYARNFEQKAVTDYLKYIAKIGADQKRTFLGKTGSQKDKCSTGAFFKGDKRDCLAKFAGSRGFCSRSHVYFLFRAMSSQQFYVKSRQQPWYVHTPMQVEVCRCRGIKAR